jgi:hypothetical protein
MQCRFRSAVALAMAVCLIGSAACDVDLFGTDAQPMVGPYKLMVWEGGKYSLVTDKRDSCGVLEGHVLRIGWNERVILAEQETCSAEKDRSGWMVIDLKTQKLEGPFDAATIRARPDLTGIDVKAADVVWKKLRWRSQ